MYATTTCIHLQCKCTPGVQCRRGGAEDLRQTCAHVQIGQGQLIHEVRQLERAPPKNSLSQ